jgi:hypothetical protein
MKFNRITTITPHGEQLYKGKWFQIIVGGEVLFDSTKMPARFTALSLHHVADRYLLTISSKKAYDVITYSTEQCVEIIEENFFDF